MPSWGAVGHQAGAPAALLPENKRVRAPGTLWIAGEVLSFMVYRIYMSIVHFLDQNQSE